MLENTSFLGGHLSLIIFYPKKYQNFHGCALTIALADHQLFIMTHVIFSELLNARLIECESNYMFDMTRLIVTFQEKMQKAVEEKWEIATGNVDDNYLTTQYDLIEGRFIGEENSMKVEDVDSDSINEVVVELEMCEDKSALIHPEPIKKTTMTFTALTS